MSKMREDFNQKLEDLYSKFHFQFPVKEIIDEEFKEGKTKFDCMINFLNSFIENTSDID